MARLNEPPPMSTDSSDILRKKLLRQNRELARANSGLAQKVRLLEQEKQQLINQKLEIAGRLLDLEQKIERNAAQRIADHALNVRARLEAQLRDCMNLLEDIGQEPPRKRRQAASPGSARASKPRSPPRRRLVETERDAEVRATAEGRLPPLYESKAYPYPRQTLNPDQIMALCSEAADTTDSPELGPPPMSRFVDSEVDTSKLPSPSKSPSPPRALPSPTTTKLALPASSSSPTKLQTTSGNIEVSGASPMKIPDIFRSLEEDVQPKVPEALRSSSKRKFSASDSQDTNPKPKSSDTPKPRITATVRTDRKNKTLKELVSIRREAREELAPPTEPRKVLAAKSTNEDMNSPKKVSKPPGDGGPQKPLKPKDAQRKDRPRPKAKESEKPTIAVPAPAPTSPKPVEDVVLSSSIGAVPLSPASPEPTPFSVQAHGTPPPADISAHGETARPSRRARAAVSYAEPNLRDKMRRPTKELFDAVAGEGRYKPRSSTSRSEEPPSVDMASAKQHSTTIDDGKSRTSTIPTATEAFEKPSACSPLAQKTTNKAHRNNKTSSALSKNNEEFEASEQASPLGRDAGSSALKDTAETLDPYDFASTLPSVDSSKGAGDKVKPSSRRQSKSSRRLSSVARDDFQFEDEESNLKPKSAAGRKRASIAHTRVETSLMDDENPDTSGSTEGEVVSRPTARRRSMMV